jgi:uncharacterized protein involved in outer membrane biogenesis
MKKALTIVGIVVALVAVAVAGVFIYAARNLDSIIAEREPMLLERLSDSLNRKIEVSSIKVSLGWGLVAELDGVKIADDPALSDQPFIEAGHVDANVELLPLLSRHVHITEVTLKNPEVHIIRTEAGEFNVSTLGKKHDESETKPAAEPAPATTQGGEGAPLTAERTIAQKKRQAHLNSFYIKDFVVNDAVITYEERGPNHQSVAIHDVDLALKGFSFARAFEVSLKLAMLSDKQNVDISGTMGPLIQNGVLDAKVAPLAMDAKVGPLDLARLRAIGAIGKAIPDALSVPDPISLDAKANGTPSALEFHIDTDLTGARVAWAESFDKPASTTLKLSADGTRTESGVEIAQANAKLADLEANLRNIKLGGGAASARIDTNRFDLGAMAKMIPALQKYHASGQAEVHADLSVANKQLSAKGTVSLADVALTRPGDQKSLVSGMTGDIKLNGNAADAGPLKFNLGSGHATAIIHAHSLQPLRADYEFSADTIKVSEFAPKRPDDEHLSNLALSGSIAQAPELSVSAKGSASEGNLANVPFKDLNLAATMGGQGLNLKSLGLQSLKLSAFNGDIAASGNATLTDPPQFALNLTANNVDIPSALRSQQSKAAGMIQGVLDGQLQVSGKGATLDAITPTLDGKGAANVRNGKLVGINLAAEGLKKTKGLPGIGDLIPASVVERHQELFNSPDTQIDSVALTFVIRGPRLTTHDLLVQTPDYGMTGDGWFDMDKNLEMGTHVLLTRALSREIIAEKHNVVYITNNDGQVDVPMMVSGRLPKPAVAPDIAELAERVGSQLLNQQSKALGKLFKKGKKLNIPFLSNDGGEGNSSGNPLDQLKGLFH